MKELKFIRHCIELAGKALGGIIKMLYRVIKMLLRVIWKPGAFIKVHPTCLTAFIALIGFAMALVVFLAFFINKDSWSFRLQECSTPRTTPSFLQIQVLGDSEHSSRDVVVDPEKNPWIDKLINALHDAGKRQSDVPAVDPNPISNVVIDRGKNPWIDELLAVLRNAAETQVSDTSAREDIGQQMHCADDANSSTVCPAPQAGASDTVAPDLREHIRAQMNCAADDLKMSGFIRFSNNNASINDVAQKMKINEFVARIDKRASRWGVFGFASEAGEKDRNRKLSWQRACGVTKYICNEYNCQSSGLDCNTYPKDRGEKVEVKHTCTVSDGNSKNKFLIYPLGEDHFINGVADSRSVAIAACGARE